MVIYETISGHFPFHHHGDLAVIAKVLAGERPPRGAGFTDSLWKMLELCWASRPDNRPGIGAVLQCLGGGGSNPPELPFEVDQELGENNDEWDSPSDSSGMLSCIIPL